MQRRSFLKSLTVGSTMIASGCALNSSTSASRGWLMYVGTYTGPKSQGIYVFRFDPVSGAIEPMGLAAEVKNPSFLAIHPDGKHLYTVNETSDWQGKPGGSVTAFRIEGPSGKLTKLNALSSGGDGPCHLSVDKTGRCVLVANYGGGSVASLSLNDDGSLKAQGSFHQHAGPVHLAERQGGPHGHSINVSPDNQFAFAADLGLDKILIYRLDPAQGTITRHDPPHASVAPGSGPRHFTFLPNGRFAYVINEISCTVTGFAYDPKRGSLREIQTVSTLPAGQSVKPEYSTAEIVAHPTGRFIYGSNRGHDTIAVFSVDSDGKLTLVENTPTQGKTPRNFAVDPTGRYLFAENQSSDSIVVFHIDASTGRLKPTGQVLQVGSPVCIRFVRLG
jgi:6-phosphogluconolactonase